jgi:hypothetical protein
VRPPTHEHVFGEPVKGTQHCTVEGCAALHHECTLARNERGFVVCEDCGSGFAGFRLPGEPAPAGVETDLTRINTHQWVADQIGPRDRKRNREFYRGQPSAEDDGETLTARSRRALGWTTSDPTLPGTGDDEGATRSRGRSI